MAIRLSFRVTLNELSAFEAQGKQYMHWIDASISEKAIRLAAIGMGTILLRYLMTPQEGTVFDLLLMLSAWCLLLSGMFLFRAKKQFWPVLVGMGSCLIAIFSAI